VETSARNSGAFLKTAKEAIDPCAGSGAERCMELAAAGAWNIEVVRNGASVLARAVYGGAPIRASPISPKPSPPIPRICDPFSNMRVPFGYDFDSYAEDRKNRLASWRCSSRPAYEQIIKQRAARLLDLEPPKNAVRSGRW